MRILNVIGSRLVFGAERVVFELTKALLQKRQSVSVLCSPELSPFYRQTGAEVIPLVYRGFGHLVATLALTRLEGSFDVVHLHGISASIIGALAPLPSGKFLMTAHGSEGEALTDAPRNLRDMLTRICVLRTASRSREIVTVTSYLAENFSQFGRKVSTVLNGVNVNMVRAMAAQHADYAKWLKERRKGRAACLFLPGRLSVRSKGQDIIIQAMDILRNRGIDCFLLLSGIGEDLHRLQNMTENLHITERIFFLDYLPRGVQLAYMANSNVIVTHLVEQRFGGVSQVHLEAAVLARPIVTMFHPDLEVFKDSSYFVDDNDPRKVASTIQHVIEHSEEAEERALRGAIIAERKFSWENVVDRYLKIYSALHG